MIDIIEVGEDILYLDTQTERAKNILSVQIGALEYAPDLGIDLKFFLSEEFKFQNESFISYCVQILANYGINVSTVVETVSALFVTDTFNLTPAETDGSLLAQ